LVTKPPDFPEPAPTELAARASDRLAEEPEEPPVVARLIVEIRSDGTRTVARGALEDVASGERVAIVARGTTPMALAASLAKSLFAAPALARHTVKALLQGRRRRE
jgi:hypothetical protein